MTGAITFFATSSGRLARRDGRVLVDAWRRAAPPYRPEAHLVRAVCQGGASGSYVAPQFDEACSAVISACQSNALGRAEQLHALAGAKARVALSEYSLGALARTDPRDESAFLDGLSTFVGLLAAVRSSRMARSLATEGLGVSAGAATDRLCARVMLGEEIGLRMTRFLVRRLPEETAWARRVVVAKCASIAALRAGRVAWAAKIAVRARRGYEALRKLERTHRPKGPRPRLLQLYEEHCRAVLRSFSPPLRGGRTPVRALMAAVRQLPPRRRRSRVRTTIAALDALVAVGRGTDARGLHDRVVRELARMVGARVLLHYEGGGYRALEHQRHHTLGTWTIRCLVREREITARRVRPRPEFWRPEQRRPGGVLSFPLGDGTACLARGRAFRAEEVEAVRVVLGFLRERLAEPDGVAPRESLPASAGAIESRPALRPVQGIVGNSAPWRQVMSDVWRVARGDVPVLLLGETGTGKEVVARAIHLTSGRAQRPFVAASCATLRGDTLLSELFGHVRGAFSGAVRNHKGLFERAHRGTLFLDELGEASPELQVALLRVLQDGVVRPVGSVASRDVSVRVVAATNRDLEAARRDGRFREDLYHRLAAVTLRLPPLRERLEDVPLLASHLLARHAPERALHPEALAALVAYDWPGNVRELENILRAAALLCDDTEIPAATIRQAIDGRREARRRAVRPTHLAPRAQALLTTMRTGWWSAAELADRMGLAHRTVNRELNALADRGLIEMTGEAKARRYRRQHGARSEGLR